MKVIIDNGHGEPCLTGGKHSPDYRLREYRYCREIARRVCRELALRGVDSLMLVPEKEDVPLKERVRRVNAWVGKLGRENVLLVSVHVNGAGSDGQWHGARGFSVFVSRNASECSKTLARIFTRRAEAAGLLGNRYVPAERYWVESLAMTRDTRCPAVLTENLFQDNKDDVDFLVSDQGRAAIVQLHVKSIMDYLEGKKDEG